MYSHIHKRLIELSKTEQQAIIDKQNDKNRKREYMRASKKFNNVRAFNIRAQSLIHR